MDALIAERAVVQALGGGCQMPLGALATRRRADDLVDPRLGRVARTAAGVIRAIGRAATAATPAAAGEKLRRRSSCARGAGEILARRLHTK